ncbi:single-stranded DNA-binding protein [Candidatus Phytoplasma asteris]
MGHLNQDLEKQYINSNNEQIPKIDLQLAVNSKDITQFIPCVVFRNQAENMDKYLHKGSKIYPKGTISIQKNTKVIINNIIFLDNKFKEILSFNWKNKY